jgi:hypothetical protein
MSQSIRQQDTIETSVVVRDLDSYTRGMEQAARSTEGLGTAQQKTGAAAEAASAGLKAFAALGMGIAFERQVKGIVMASAELEQYGKQFKVLTGSASAARGELEQLYQFAVKTPFSIGGIVEAQRMVHAFDVGVGDSIQTLEAYGNAAAAMGVSLHQVVAEANRLKSGQYHRRLAAAVGFAPEFAMREGIKFTEAGEAINREDLFPAFIRSIQRFNGMMEEMSDSTQTKLINLQEAFFLFQRNIGDELNPAVNAFADLLTGALLATKNLDPGLLRLIGTTALLGAGLAKIAAVAQGWIAVKRLGVIAANTSAQANLRESEASNTAAGAMAREAAFTDRATIAKQRKLQAQAQELAQNNIILVQEGQKAFALAGLAATEKLYLTQHDIANAEKARATGINEAMIAQMMQEASAANEAAMAEGRLTQVIVAKNAALQAATATTAATTPGLLARAGGWLGSPTGQAIGGFAALAAASSAAMEGFTPRPAPSLGGEEPDFPTLKMALGRMLATAGGTAWATKNPLLGAGAGLAESGIEAFNFKRSRSDIDDWRRLNEAANGDQIRELEYINQKLDAQLEKVNLLGLSEEERLQVINGSARAYEQYLQVLEAGIKRLQQARDQLPADDAKGRATFNEAIDDTSKTATFVESMIARRESERQQALEQQAQKQMEAAQKQALSHKEGLAALESQAKIADTLKAPYQERVFNLELIQAGERQYLDILDDVAAKIRAMPQTDETEKELLKIARERRATEETIASLSASQQEIKLKEIEETESAWKRYFSGLKVEQAIHLANLQAAGDLVGIERARVEWNQALNDEAQEYLSWLEEQIEATEGNALAEKQYQNFLAERASVLQDMAEREAENAEAARRLRERDISALEKQAENLRNLREVSYQANEPLANRLAIDHQLLGLDDELLAAAKEDLSTARRNADTLKEQEATARILSLEARKRADSAADENEALQDTADFLQSLAKPDYGRQAAELAINFKSLSDPLGAAAEKTEWLAAGIARDAGQVRILQQELAKVEGQLARADLTKKQRKDFEALADDIRSRLFNTIRAVSEATQPMIEALLAPFSVELTPAEKFARSQIALEKFASPLQAQGDEMQFITGQWQEANQKAAELLAYIRQINAALGSAKIAPEQKLFLEALKSKAVDKLSGINEWKVSLEGDWQNLFKEQTSRFDHDFKRTLREGAQAFGAATQGELQQLVINAPEGFSEFMPSQAELDGLSGKLRSSFANALPLAALNSFSQQAGNGMSAAFAPPEWWGNNARATLFSQVRGGLDNAFRLNQTTFPQMNAPQFPLPPLEEYRQANTLLAGMEAPTPVANLPEVSSFPTPPLSEYQQTNNEILQIADSQSLVTQGVDNWRDSLAEVLGLFGGVKYEMPEPEQTRPYRPPTTFWGDATPMEAGTPLTNPLPPPPPQLIEHVFPGDEDYPDWQEVFAKPQPEEYEPAPFFPKPGSEPVPPMAEAVPPAAEVPFKPEDYPSLPPEVLKAFGQLDRYGNPIVPPELVATGKPPYLPGRPSLPAAPAQEPAATGISDIAIAAQQLGAAGSWLKDDAGNWLKSAARGANDFLTEKAGSYNTGRGKSLLPPMTAPEDIAPAKDANYFQRDASMEDNFIRYLSYANKPNATPIVLVIGEVNDLGKVGEVVDNALAGVYDQGRTTAIGNPTTW